MASDYSLSSATTDSSSQPRRSGHELGRMHHQQHPRPHPLPRPQLQPQDLHEAVLREIEKESMRQEIIKSEIIRRHALEAGVNYAKRMERAMAIQRGRDGLDVPARFPPAEMRAERMFREERIIFPPPSNNWREGGGSNF